MGRVKALLTGEEADYCADFTETEWAAITERLEALARLVWKVSQRQGRAAQAGSGLTKQTGLREDYQTAMP
jgi:hypothetical protein